LVIWSLLYTSRRFFFPLKTFSHTSIHVQGNIYTHVAWTIVYTSVYLYTGVLNYKTVWHMGLLVYGTHTYFNIKQFPVYIRLMDGDWSIHVLVDVWDMSSRYCSYCPLKVNDFCLWPTSYRTTYMHIHVVFYNSARLWDPCNSPAVIIQISELNIFVLELVS